jgi:heme exporter protein D
MMESILVVAVGVTLILLIVQVFQCVWKKRRDRRNAAIWWSLLQ